MREEPDVSPWHQVALAAALLLPTPSLERVFVFRLAAYANSEPLPR